MIQAGLFWFCLWLGAPETVTASWYGEPFHGRATASGEVFDMNGMTCAHRTLPFGALLLVRHGGRAVVVRVNDRGPYAVGEDGRACWPLRPHPSRTLDLSLGAAAKLAMRDEGVSEVRVWRVQ